MYNNIMDIIRCPKCKGKLQLEQEVYEGDEIIDGKLSCPKSHSWLIKDGVINFESQEQELGNNWSEYYKKTNYEELDEKIRAATPDNLIEGYYKAKSRLIEIVRETKAHRILDIATGRGMLLTELVKHIKEDSELICVDLSHDVLKYDRLKVKRLRPELMVNFIACDATKLPFEDKAVDLAVSFAGIQNMLDIMEDGVKEANRVSRAGLANMGIVVSNTSKGLKECEETLRKYGVTKAHLLFTEGGFKKIHEAAGFGVSKIETVYEGIGEKCETDLIPFEGEWFSIVIASCC